MEIVLSIEEAAEQLGTGAEMTRFLICVGRLPDPPTAAAVRECLDSIAIHPVSIYLSADILARADRAAALQGVTRAAWLQSAISAQLTTDRRRPGRMPRGDTQPDIDN